MSTANFSALIENHLSIETRSARARAMSATLSSILGAITFRGGSVTIDIDTFDEITMLATDAAREVRLLDRMLAAEGGR